MARQESEFDSDSNFNPQSVRSNQERRNLNQQFQSHSTSNLHHPSTTNKFNPNPNPLQNPVPYLIKKPSDPNKWTSINPSTSSSRDRDRVGGQRDQRSLSRGTSAIPIPPENASRHYSETPFRSSHPAGFHSGAAFDPPPRFSSPGPGHSNPSRSYHGKDAYTHFDSSFKPPPPMVPMAPPYSRASSISRPETMMATPPPSNIGSSPYQTRPQQIMMAPPRHGPPISLVDRSGSSSSISLVDRNGSSSSSSNYSIHNPQFIPSWNPNSQAYPPPPRSVSSSSSSSYRHPSASFSNRFHPAHPLARTSSSIQSGIGSPYGPPSLRGGLPSLGRGIGIGSSFNRSQSVRSGSIAPSNLSRNTTNSVRNRKILPKGDWDTVMGMVQDSKDNEKQKALEKEREKQREREKELRKEISKKAEEREELSSIPVAEPQQSLSINQNSREESVDEIQVPKQTSQRSSKVKQATAEELQAKVVPETSTTELVLSPPEENVPVQDSSIGQQEPSSLLENAPQVQDSTSLLPVKPSTSKSPKKIKIPALSSWYLCHAPVRSIPSEILKTHPHASTLKSWVHLQGFRIGGDQNGNVWKSSALLSRISPDEQSVTSINQSYHSEALDQFELMEKQNLEKENQKNEGSIEIDSESELKNLVSRLSTSSGKVYEIRGRFSKKEMIQRGFTNCLEIMKDEINPNSQIVNQVWPEDEIWIEAVIQDLIMIERKIKERRIQKKIKKEMEIDSKKDEDGNKDGDGDGDETKEEVKEEVEAENEDNGINEEFEISKILQPTSPVGLKRIRKPSFKVEENLKSIQSIRSKGEASATEKLSSEIQGDKEVTSKPNGRRARKSSPFRKSKSEAEENDDSRSSKRKRRSSETFEHSFELIIPAYEKNKSAQTITREVEAEKELEIESEDRTREGNEEIDEQEKKKEKENEREEEQQKEVEEIEPTDSAEVEMPPLDDFRETEDTNLDSREMDLEDALEKSTTTLQEPSSPQKEELEVKDDSLQAPAEISIDEEVADVTVETQNQAFIPSVDSDELEGSPESLFSTSKQPSSSRTPLPSMMTSKSGTPKTKWNVHESIEGTLQKNLISISSKSKKPRASAPSASTSKSSSLVGPTKISRELASLTKSRFGTLNFLKPKSVNQITRREKVLEEEDDDEVEEIREKEIMESSPEDQLSSNLKSKMKSSKKDEKKEKKKSRRSLPITSKELHQSHSNSSSDFSRSNSSESLDLMSTEPLRSSTRTRITSKPREWWIVNEDTFRSPLDKSNDSMIKRTLKNSAKRKRFRDVEEDEVEETDGDEDQEDEENSSRTNRSPIKRFKPSRLANDSPSNSESEEVLKKGNQKIKRKNGNGSGKQRRNSSSLTYGRNSSRSPKKKESNSFEVNEDAYVFSD